MLHYFILNHPNGQEWHKYLQHFAFSFRELPSLSRGLSPFQLVYGRPARGPLAVLKDSWEQAPLPDEKQLPATEKYLADLQMKLFDGRQIASECVEAMQERNEQAFNVSARDKEFEVGDLVVVLLPTSSNKLVSRWMGPATVVGKKSPYSYTVALDNGSVRLLHANQLKPFYLRINALGVMFEDEEEFGDTSLRD